MLECGEIKWAERVLATRNEIVENMFIMAQNTIETTVVGSNEKHVYIKIRVGVKNVVEKTCRMNRGNVKSHCCCGGNRQPK